MNMFIRNLSYTQCLEAETIHVVIIFKWRSKRTCVHTSVAVSESSLVLIVQYKCECV